MEDKLSADASLLSPLDLSEIQTLIDNGIPLETVAKAYNLTELNLRTLVQTGQLTNPAITEPKNPIAITLDEFYAVFGHLKYDNLEDLNEALKYKIQFVSVLKAAQGSAQFDLVEIEKAIEEINSSINEFLQKMSDYLSDPRNRHDYADLFFGIKPSTVFSREEVIRNFRNLSRFFHPDKAGSPVFAPVFGLLVQTKEKLLRRINCTQNANDLIQLANQQLVRARSESNKKLCAELCDRAYSYYRDACVALDEESPTQKEAGPEASVLKAEIRLKMARCFYIQKKYLQAQLYIIGAINYIYNYLRCELHHEKRITKLFNEALDFLKNLRLELSGVLITTSTSQVTSRAIPTTIIVENEVTSHEDLYRALVISQQLENSLSTGAYNQNSLESIKKQANKQIDLSLTNQVILPEKALIKYAPNKFQYLQYSWNDAVALRKHDVLGFGGFVGFFSGMNGIIFVGKMVCSLWTAPINKDFTDGLFDAALVLILGATSIVGGIALVKNSQSGIQKLQSKYSDSFVSTIDKALEHHIKGDYHQALKAFAEIKLADGHSFIKFQPELGNTNFFDLNWVIERLKKYYEVPPHGIAYLLLIIADCLMSRKLQIKGVELEQIDAEAKKVLDSIIDEKSENSLSKYAKELDESLCKELEEAKSKFSYQAIPYELVLVSLHEMFSEKIEGSKLYIAIDENETLHYCFLDEKCNMQKHKITEDNRQYNDVKKAFIEKDLLKLKLLLGIVLKTNLKRLEAVHKWNECDLLYNDPLIHPELKSALEDAPLSTRLELIQILAKLNLASLMLISGTEISIARAKGLLKEVKNKYYLINEDYQDRFSVIVEFMAIFGYEKFQFMSKEEQNVNLLMDIAHKDYQQRISYLQSVRDIHLVKNTQGKIEYCEVIPALPDGNCAFSAIQSALLKQGYNLEISRKSFIKLVYELNNSSQIHSDTQKIWDDHLKAIYADARVNTFEAWRNKFSSSGYWVNETHLKFISKYFGIRMHLFKLSTKDELHPNERGDCLMPYPGDTHTVWEGKEEPQYDVNLLHIPLGPIGENTVSPLIHFEGLHIPKIQEFAHLIAVTEQINQGTDQNKRTILYQKRVGIYKNLAMANEFKWHVHDALGYWENALNDYEKIASFVPKEIILEVYAEIIFCCTKLSLFPKAYEYVTKVSEFEEFKKSIYPAQKARLLYLKALTCYKLKDWKSAKAAILLLRAMKNYDESAIQQLEKQIAKAEERGQAFSKKGLANYVAARKPVNADHYTLTNVRLNEEQPYKILSIDGGGIRGILPCIWLSNIEKQLKRPLGTVFDLIAGTSTGAIIGGGLSIKNEGSPTGYYTPDDLLEIYTVKAKNIFGQPRYSFSQYFQSKYRAVGLETELDLYFKNKKLSDCVPELLVTSFETSTLHTTYIFTSREARQDKEKDFYLKDVLCASASAPTFFPEKRIGHKVFVDGGVKANNPTKKAWEYATNLHKITKDTVVLSLGTGEYIPDPVTPTKHRGLLFWAKNIANVTLSGQEYETHREMTSLFSSRANQYFRFFPLLEKEIPLDAKDDNSLQTLIEIGEETWEEENNRDDNRLNKFIEKLI